MKIRSFLLSVLWVGLGLNLTFSTTSIAGMTAYQIDNRPADPAHANIHFDIGYTAGTHHGGVGQTSGTVQASLNPFHIQSGSIVVPIASIVTGDTKRDCHLRESLGIDYSHSKYPTEHVCDSHQQLPLSGPDAVAFPDIKLEFENWVPASTAALNLSPGTSIDIEARVKLTLHGITQEGITIPLHLNYPSGSQGEIEVTGKFNVSISQFGVIIKKFLFVSVDDLATVHLNLIFKPKS